MTTTCRVSVRLSLVALALVAPLACAERPSDRDGGIAGDDVGIVADQSPRLDSLIAAAESGPAPDRGSTLDDEGAVFADSGLPEADQGQPPPPPAGELLLFDGKDLQFTSSDNGFHALVNPGDALPASNWLSPVDFYEGQFQIRYVVTGPPDQQPGQLQTCIWTMPGWSPESCSAQVPHDGVGEYYNTNLVPSQWWKKDGVPVDFAHPEHFLIRAVLRGPSGCNVTSYNVSFGCPDEFSKYQAMKFRVTIVMVPKGASFSGWASYP